MDRSDLEPLYRFARKIANHWFEILGFFLWNGMTNAVLEGTNNKIKMLIHFTGRSAFTHEGIDADGLPMLQQDRTDTVSVGNR